MEEGDVTVGIWNPWDTVKHKQAQPIASFKINIYLSWEELQRNNQPTVDKIYHRINLPCTVYSDGDLEGLENLCQEISVFFGPIVTEARKLALKEWRVEPKEFYYWIECHPVLIRELATIFSVNREYQRIFGLDTFLKGCVAFCKLKPVLSPVELISPRSGAHRSPKYLSLQKKRKNLFKSVSLANMVLNVNKNKQALASSV